MLNGIRTVCRSFCNWRYNSHPWAIEVAIALCANPLPTVRRSFVIWTRPYFVATMIITIEYKFPKRHFNDTPLKRTCSLWVWALWEIQRLNSSRKADSHVNTVHSQTPSKPSWLPTVFTITSFQGPFEKQKRECVILFSLPFEKCWDELSSLCTVFKCK